MADNRSDDYDSYDKYLENAAKSVTQSVISEQTSQSTSHNDDYGSYDDYVNGKNSSSDGGITSDEGDSNTGGEDNPVTSSDNRGKGDITAESDRHASIPGVGEETMQSDNVLLQDGGASGASSFSEGGGIIQNAKGAIGGAANGVKNALMGGFGGMLSMIKNSFGKAKSGVNGIAGNLGVSAKAVVTVLSLLGGGSVATIAALLGDNSSEVAKYSDYAMCNHIEMIDDYKANNGKGDNWKLSSAQGMAKSIYTALSSDAPVTFDTMMWDGSTWVDTTVTNDGFNFSDEVIAGMVSNAYGESKVRPDCYEMDYYVHNIDEKNPDGSYKWTLADCDFILGRTHHSNWDNYVERMFELYAASGMSIQESTYGWKSEEGMQMFADVAVPGLSGLYPGVGLWQWTGQRAYDLGRFANIQPDPVDKDQDSTNDIMYGLNCQLAFLYLENFGNFTEYGVSESGVLAWGREQGYTFRGVLGANDGRAMKNLSYGVIDSSFVAEGANLDITDDVFKGQQQENLDETLDVWNPAEDILTIRFPKFWVYSTAMNAYVGDGSGEECRNQDGNEGHTVNWTPYGVTLDTYMTTQDNQAKERWYTGDDDAGKDEAERLKGSDTLTPMLAKLSNGKDDEGYWSVTAEDTLAGGDATYRLTEQKRDGHGEGSPSREGEVIRVGRTFNDEEIDTLFDLYGAGNGIEGEPYTDDEGNEHIAWYYYVTWTLNEDSTRTTGPEPGSTNVYDYDQWVPAHNDMSAYEGENAKFIARDMRLAAGAEAAAECALQYFNKWEGMEGHIDMVRSHTQEAGSFYILQQTDKWKSDDDFASSILNMVDENLTDAELREMHATYTNMGCDEVSRGFDGIAEAAVSWAWPKGTDWYDVNDESTMDGGGDCYWQTKCTSLYIAVKDVVEPGDVLYYSSCCRGVSTAVRASGADDNMVLGGAKGILDYCKAHPEKWENLGMITSVSFLQTLEPGDLLLSDGHVMVFVGPDIPLEKWPGGAGELTDCELAAVHASRSSSLANSRGPRCDNSCEWLVSDSKTWYAYRLVNYESSSKWKTLAEGMNFGGLKDGSEANH